MKGTYPFSILVKDYENSSKIYKDVVNCPAATAFKRLFPQLKFSSVGTNSGFCFYEGENWKKFTLKESFEVGNYRRLADENEEFHTEISF